MTKRELEKILNASNIDRFAYDLNGGLPNEAYCMEEIGGKWYTYYSERGQRTSLKAFETDSQAELPFLFFSSSIQSGEMTGFVCCFFVAVHKK